MQEKLTIEHILQNDDFVVWVKSGKTVSRQVWSDIIFVSSISDKLIYKEAELILTNLFKLDVDSFASDINDFQIEKNYSKLLEKHLENNQKPGLFSMRSVFKYVAAVFAPIAVAGIVYSFNDTEKIFESNLVTEQYSSDKLQIKTSEGVYYTLPSTKKSWMFNGLFITADKNELVIRQTDDYTDNNVDEYTVLVPRADKYSISLVDGTSVELNSESSLSFNIYDGNKREVKLNGEAYFDVEKDKTRPFIVHTENMDVEVLGTEFNISTYNSNKYFTATLIEGSVKIITPDGSVRKIKPSEQARVLLGDNKIEVRKVEVQNVVAWTSERFVFEDELLINLMPKLERWYNIDFTIDDSLKEMKFTGTITPNKSLLHLLQMFKYSEGVSYKIERNTVFLYKK